jgi:hypothetical protein
LKEDGQQVQIILDFEESKARTTRWGRHYFDSTLLQMTSANATSLDTDADNAMDLDQDNVERQRLCVSDHFPSFKRSDGSEHAPPFSWSDAPKLPKDILYKKLGSIRHCIRNAILVVQSATSKFDEAVQQSSFKKQAYEKLLSLRRNGEDEFLWTPENTTAFVWVEEPSEGESISNGETNDGHSSGTSLASSALSDSSEDSNGDNGDLIYGNSDSGSAGEDAVVE